MKLLLKIVDTQKPSGQSLLALCDENGEALPCQVSCTVDCRGVAETLVTACFFVDGEHLKMVPSCD